MYSLANRLSIESRTETKPTPEGYYDIKLLFALKYLEAV